MERKQTKGSNNRRPVNLKTEYFRLSGRQWEHTKNTGNQAYDIPAVLYGNQSDKVYLFLHGKNGFKEEAYDFAKIACEDGWQVLSIDLPGHGDRVGEAGRFVPWFIIPELETVMQYVKGRFNKIGLRANSIGAYFSLICYPEEPLTKCLLAKLCHGNILPMLKCIPSQRGTPQLKSCMPVLTT